MKDIAREILEHYTYSYSEIDVERIARRLEEIRKETARDILKPLYDVIMEHPDCCVNLSEDIKFLMKNYGIDLENEECRSRN